MMMIIKIKDAQHIIVSFHSAQHFFWLFGTFWFRSITLNCHDDDDNDHDDDHDDNRHHDHHDDDND